MAHIMGKWLEEGKGIDKWHKICVIAKGKMSLSRVVVSLYTSIKERLKCVGKSSEVLYQRKQKLSTRLCDKVIVREWVQNKSHHHVHESRTFSKGLIWCKLKITPIRRVLVESGNHFIIGHSPQTLITRVVKKLDPRDRKHIGYQLQCDNNARTSNASIKERY